MLRPEHLEKVMRWRTLPEVTRYMFTDPILTLEQQKKWYERVSHNPSFRYWVINCDNEDIGVLNLYDLDMTNRRCSWAYYIGENAYQGKGIASILEYNVYEYAFYRLDLNKVWSEVLSWNTRVIEIHQRFGCEIEGILREHVIKNGQKMDVVRLGLLKSKWDKIRAGFTYPTIYIEE
ncbi:MAG TPA: UDP-4-amino-4,6-dideoxy-N-acetyl-beta-L-altrosamine N-acetyltransferase [Syntrophothermus lipocalidus]|nr:UDP-4-amino-4,6-dideoxy-N-acetyl-beta-L-altrosamine N-acetyltransferase [Syntrophothermus lipocalidus]